MSSREDAERLGRLYDECLFAIRSSPNVGSFRVERIRLCERYPEGDVDWMFGVVADDLRAARARSPRACQTLG